MNVEHDMRPCTPRGHSAFVGYDAILGKMQSLYGRSGLASATPSEVAPGGACRCNVCGKWLGTAKWHAQHMRTKHGLSA